GRPRGSDPDSASVLLPSERRAGVHHGGHARRVLHGRGLVPAPPEADTPRALPPQPRSEELSGNASRRRSRSNHRGSGDQENAEAEACRRHVSLLALGPLGGGGRSGRLSRSVTRTCSEPPASPSLCTLGPHPFQSQQTPPHPLPSARAMLPKRTSSISGSATGTSRRRTESRQARIGWMRCSAG